MQLSDLLSTKIINYAIIRYFMIHYAIKMIYYAIKWFTIELLDFLKNLLVPVEAFNWYQILGEKRGRVGVEPGPRRLE